MNAVRQQLRKAKKLISTCQNRVDQWVLRNPLAIWNHMRFRIKQRIMFNTRNRRIFMLIKMFLAGYLASNLIEIDLNQYTWAEPRRVMTQYQNLANTAEYDQLDTAGQERHLKQMFERGMHRGLSQIQLFELSKYLQLNHTSKNVVYHAEYLRNLKS